METPKNTHESWGQKIYVNHNEILYCNSQIVLEFSFCNMNVIFLVNFPLACVIAPLAVLPNVRHAFLFLY